MSSDTNLKGDHIRTIPPRFGPDWPSSFRRRFFNSIFAEFNSSEATGPIWTKLWWNGPWMAPFQNCVRWPRPLTKMSADWPSSIREDFFNSFFAEFSIFSNSGHLGWWPGSSNTILKGDHLVKWAIVTTERPSSVNFSHFNQLLWSHWANLNQTSVEWSFGDNRQSD
jgi:hypothetical protein